ncbi:MAG: hypothetical protein GY708_20575, partial [Actinomycetia bacterium]|nr:hypothetical protein [Actinomycetes bacterium]
VTADNTSGIDATILSSTATGDTGVGVTLAFNTIGWESQNVLFNTIDALLGDTLIGDEQPAEVIAAIEDSTVDGAGNLAVTADNDIGLNATVSNAATSEASALFGATGMSASAVLASNKVSTDAKAYVEDTDGTGTTDVDTGGSVTIAATDQAGIFSNTKIVSSSTTTNDGGASVLQETINDFLDADHTTDNNAVTLAFGDRVRLDDDYAVADYDTDPDPLDTANLESPVEGDFVEVKDGYLTHTYDTTESGVQLVTAGEVVLIKAGSTHGSDGDLYKYINSTDLDLSGGSDNLGNTNYTDNSLWAKVGGTEGAIYKMIVSGGSEIDLAATDYSDTNTWVEVAGNAGSVYEFLGQDGIDPSTGSAGTTDLSQTIYTDLDYWKEVPETSIIPQGLNVTGSDSIAIGGIVVVNDVRAEVEAYVKDASISTTDGDVDVAASEDATITA